MTALGNVSALSAAVLYGVLSLSMAFLNKAVISQYKFNFPFFILSCQMMLTLIILEVMRALGKFGLPSITMAAVKMFAFPAFCYSLHAILSLVALAGMNIPMYGAVKRCTPLVNLVLAVTYLRKPMPSSLVITSIVTITIGCLIAGMGDPSFNGFAYMFGGVSVVLQAVYQTLVQQCGENKLSPLHVLHLNSCISLVPFVILTFGKGELKAVLTYQYIGDRSFHLIFITLLVMGLLLNFSMFLCTMLNSALTTSIVGVSKSVLQTFIGFFTFGGVIFDAVNIAGIALNTCGGVLYTYAKYEDQKTRWRKIDLGDTGIQQAGWELKEKLMPVS
ncbi:uncharacterized protein [Procambarus clarkii]|nr:UDP-galactose/UDP-glucose transporter 7-like [Procambarus clarkii]XP_045605831.1 UDP-galactose/UDP-glucose transporter 7-like [Procambarus clarkii]XP_045605833.1 UDP-galactose/UDP-glucose transporter 7-like [Procambarus clarkii]